MTAVVMRGKYLVRDLHAAAYLRVLDAMLARSRASGPEPTTIRRLAIGIGGHLGDGIIASSVLPLVRSQLPEAEIGLVLPSWIVPALSGHPAVRHFHVVDHWKLNRSQDGMTRFTTSFATHRRAVREMIAVGYDAAVDLYPYYPNMALVFRRSRIPIRIGYESGGAGPAYTTALPWINDGAHMAMHHRRALAEIGIRAPDTDPVYDLPRLDEATEASGRRLLDANGLARGAYVIMHPGTGDDRKRWPRENWITTGQNYLASGLGVVLTGAGASDAEENAALASRDRRFVDLSNRTTLGELRFVLRHARRVIGVDSAAVHLAAAEGVECVCVTESLTNPSQWRPLSSGAPVLLQSEVVVDA